MSLGWGGLEIQERERQREKERESAFGSVMKHSVSIFLNLYISSTKWVLPLQMSWVGLASVLKKI
jgi:hypothetical protein